MITASHLGVAAMFEGLMLYVAPAAAASSAILLASIGGDALVTRDLFFLDLFNRSRLDVGTIAAGIRLYEK